MLKPLASHGLVWSCLALAAPSVFVACNASDSPQVVVANAGSAGQGGSAGASGATAGGSMATAGSGGSAGALGGSAGSAGANGGGNGGGAAGVAGTGGASGAAGSAGSSGGATGGNGGAGGSSGNAGSGGTGGAAPYNPCPTNGDPCRIMPLGDSITDGAGSSNGAGYRGPLFHLALMNQKKLTFVGSHQSGPEMIDNTPFPKSQEGHSGWTIDDGGGRMGLYPQVQSWLMKTPPDIVTLMIGTNDVNISLELANAPTRLGLLLDRIITNAPNALIVVAQIVPTTDDTINQRVSAYNAAIPGLVKARADAGKHVIMIDMYGAFTKNDKYKAEYMNDTLHPKDPGYVAMGDTWYAAIGKMLPAK